MAVPALNCVFCILLLSTSSSISGHVAEASCRSRSRRELLGATTTVRDVFAPVTNPVTVPATNPASNSGVVTVPATNPNFPPLYPEPSTMPDPSTTIPAPFTNPVTAPITNPATTPTAVPGTSPVTNPTTYPYPPQSGGVGGMGGVPTTPVYQAPATTVPVGATPMYPAPATTVPTGAAPTTAGQYTWCVAKAGVMEAALQAGLDYACGMGGADCSALQPMGTCYNPNTMQAHASYAFNSYFQRNPSPASCDFGGAGMLVATNPSSGACVYQTSSGSGGTGFTPAVTGTTVPVGMTPGFGAAGMTPGYSTGPTTGTGPAVGGGSGSTVLNANNNPGGTSMYGPDNPTGFSGASSGAASLSCGWVLSLTLLFTIAYVKEKV